MTDEEQTNCAHGCGICDAPPSHMRTAPRDGYGSRWWSCVRCEAGHCERDCCEISA